MGEGALDVGVEFVQLGENPVEPGLAGGFGFGWLAHGWN